MAKKNQIRREKLCRLMVYVLGYRPDEFGLVPDPEGYLLFKELLQAIHEESGWGYVRQGHFNEILMGNDRALFQWDDRRIKVLEREWQMDLENPFQGLPKILFVAVRKRAHPHVLEKGLRSSADNYLTLSPDKEMAIRIGRRRDQSPVLLEIMALQAENNGISFFAFGQLFLAKEVPADYITGPPVSRDVLSSREESVPKIEERPLDFMPGSFILDLDRGPGSRAQTRGKKRKGWKEKARNLRKKRG
ncbi:MAG: RNA 2'-phosphotransferase [Gammaproteobacteria bacterium]|nr:RNA 2'-phosphotransferase [Gammaproteobacteria bacterium]